MSSIRRFCETALLVSVRVRAAAIQVGWTSGTTTENRGRPRKSDRRNFVARVPSWGDR